MDATQLYKDVRSGEVSPARLREIYGNSEIGQIYLSAYLHDGDVIGNINLAFAKEPNCILHLSKTNCASKRFGKQTTVLCVKGDSVLKHKVGECPRKK